MKKATPPEEERSPSHRHHTSAAAERDRLLARLKLGPAGTFTAMRELNFCRSGARVSELREAGYPIHMHLIRLNDDQSRSHRRVAQYYLGTVQQLSQE